MGKRIDQLTIQRILDAAKIEDVIGDFVDLKKKGARYIGLCPFHDDRHATNFSVYPEKHCYTCFACGAKGDVVKFLMEHERLSYPDAIRWLGKKYGIDVDMEDFTYTPPPPRPKPAPLPTLELPWSIVTPSEKRLDEDVLVKWIKTGIAWDGCQRNRIDEVLRQYHVGHGKKGHTIFWNIDEGGHVRTGKMMKYKSDGHRDKESSWSKGWIHASLCWRKNDADPWPFPDLYNPDKQEYKITLFGMHLLNKYPNATVNIVESEKTAILIAIAYGNTPRDLWIACGGKKMLTKERMMPILDQHRKVILYPDRDGIEEWTQLASELGTRINTIPVTKWWHEEDGEKADIADVVVNSINRNARLNPQPVSDVMREMSNKNPAMGTLINKFDLKPTNQDG